MTCTFHLLSGRPPQPCEWPLGVQPPTRPCASPNPSDLLPGGPQYPPLFVIPYPLPVGPNPSTCPCYLVDSDKGTTTTPASTRPPATGYPNGYVPPYGVLGFIPVIFFPQCPGNSANSTMIQTIHPAAMQVPYPCSYCDPNQGQIRFLDLGAQGGDSFKQVLAQAGLGLFDTPVRSISRKSRKFNNNNKVIPAS